MQVPAFDLTRQNKSLEGPLEEAFRSVAASGHFILGREVAQFEAQMGAFLGTEYAFGVANGSDALLLALLALGIGPGDEVLVPGFTFFATAGAVSRVGATPVFVDVKAANYNLDPQLLEAKITARTKAIIPVHLFGMPAAMDEILAIAKAKGLAVIEDAAQSLGTKYKNEMVGKLGDIACFSFFPTKNLGCFGDGGMVATNNPAWAEKLKMLRVHGTRKKYYHELLGFNSRLDTLQAALMLVKLPYLPQWLEQRSQLAANYRQAFGGIEELSLPQDDPGHSYNQFTMATTKREELREFLTQNKIGTTVYYPLALHLQPVFKALGYTDGDLPVSEKLTDEVFSLPIFPEMTVAEQEYIIVKVRQFFGRSGK